MAESTIRRVLAILGSVTFLVIAPGVVAGAVPRWMSGWRFQPPLLGLPGLRIAGAILVAAAVVALLDSFARFALQEIGTPAPVFPTKHLVVSGQYRFVRNPMYLAVVTAILGQALLFGNTRLLTYAALLWLGFHLSCWRSKSPCCDTASAPNTPISAPTSPAGSLAAAPGAPAPVQGKRNLFAAPHVGSGRKTV
jgi:protein-S-isoprenylcysteine O-methyltransferase Ste14